MIADLKTYPEMKDSGVEWLGEVPEHWEVRQLGRIGQFSKGNGGTKEDEVADGVPCVRYGDLYTQHRYFVINSRACVNEEKVADYTPILHGDVLFAVSSETIEEIGKSAVSASPAISTSRSRCAASKRSAPTSWCWSRRPRGCWMIFSGCISSELFH